MTHPLPPPPALSPYGADANGMVCGYRFVPDAPPQPIPTIDAAEAALHAPADGFVWLHFNLSHAQAEAWLRQHADLSENFFETLHQGSRSTRLERDGDAFFAVMNDVTFDFGFDADDVATLWVSVRRHLVVSARRQPLRSVDRLRTAVKRGQPLDGSVALLDHLLSDQADELQRIIRQATERIDDIEDILLTGRHGRHDADLARLRRLMVRLQRLLTPEPSALARTLARPPQWIGPADRERLLHASEEFGLVLRDIAALQERIKLMQDENAARRAEESNRTLFMLTMVTVLALPINLIAGLLGMNVGGIPLANHAEGFWIVIGVIGALTAMLSFVTIRRIRRRTD